MVGHSNCHGIAEFPVGGLTGTADTRESLSHCLGLRVGDVAMVGVVPLMAGGQMRQGVGQCAVAPQDRARREPALWGTDSCARECCRVEIMGALKKEYICSFKY